jgi:hypothetical protein
MRRRRWFVRIMKFAILLLVVIAGFGQAVLQLWNWLMPAIFGLHAITFWQAVGLMGLSWILFGGLRGFGHPMAFGRPRYLTPEDRDRFRSFVQHRGPKCEERGQKHI